MTEPERVDQIQLNAGDGARLLTRLSIALEEVTHLLVVSEDLHRRLAGLHSALAEPLVDLEQLLRDHAEAAPSRPNDEPPSADRLDGPASTDA
jgi:hypothetical protein